MNKFCKYFAFASVLALASCSNDEPGMNNSNNEINSGDPLYLNVTLLDANDLTSRGGENGEKDPSEDPVTGDFDYGTDNESMVNKAHFYFFDKEGTYVGQATMWKGGNANTQTPDQNIEFTANNMVVLDSLKGNTYPNYMVTVLNGPAYSDADLQYVSLKDFGKLSLNWGKNVNNGFVMTSTSYFNSDASDVNHSDEFYYATVLRTEDFARTPELAKDNQPVKVYVERLASRIHLATRTEFEVSTTVAGEINGEVVDPIAGTKLMVKINGWYINGVEEESYLCKQLGDWNINTTFASTTGTGNWNWNQPLFHRSYWGQSMNYGKLTNETLTFFPYANDNVRAAGAFDYCNENTSNVNNLKYVSGDRNLPNQQKLTSVIIKAQVGKNVNGKFEEFGEGDGLVLFNGIYFTYDRFKEYVLAKLQAENKLNYYKKTTTQTENKYEQVKAADFELAGDNTGVYVAPTADLKSLSNIVNGDKDDATAVTDFAQLESDLKEAVTGAKGYENGSMFYNVPIAHLNSPIYYTTTSDDGKFAKGDLKDWKEGSFGVVRNHTYEVKINSVKRLGTGVFLPNDNETPIKPNENPEDPNWFLGATINILSWKIVSNNVDL